MHKVLILGGSGLVGSAILNEMSSYKDFEIYTTYCKNPLKVNNCTSINFDINDLEGISNILSSLKPNIIISCLRGDFNKQLAVHIKAAEYLNKSGGRLYFFSTTNVFDNDFKRPHKEEDLSNSQTDYGQYKMECEKKIIDILHHKACILRIPQVWDSTKQILKKILKKKDILHSYQKETMNFLSN
ncbi:MAG: sugar nucleotide-binding protein [Clostridium sp.]|nr:sugar nucleotide-binding protein [Clostridium sp.]